MSISQQIDMNRESVDPISISKNFTLILLNIVDFSIRQTVFFMGQVRNSLVLIPLEFDDIFYFVIFLIR